VRDRNFKNTNIATKDLMKNKSKSKIESVHEGKKPYECDIFGKVFDEEQNFKRHIESVHEGNKPYECDTCGKVFDEE
jgi:predicted SprT family Zn-dependent metalloprotease